MMQCHVTSQCGDVRMSNLQNVSVVFTQFLYPRTDRLEKYDLQKLVEKNAQISYEKLGSCGGDVEICDIFS